MYKSAKKPKNIVRLILIIWLVFGVTDFALTQVEKAPVFAIPIPIVMHKDGGSTEYYGLGYKVIKYVNLTVERGPEVVKVDFGSWAMKFSHTR